MNADLTFNSIAFEKRFDEKSHSERASVSRGINTPDLLIIKNGPYVDSKTKVSGTQTVTRFERHNVDANGQKYITSGYVVLQVPELASSTDTSALLATLKAGVADADLLADAMAGQV